MSIVGDWNIEYKSPPETLHKTIITIYPDNIFYQKDGKYTGTWHLEDKKLTLSFPGLTREIVLMAIVNDDFEEFSGTKEDTSYIGGVLKFSATLWSSQPTPVFSLDLS